MANFLRFCLAVILTICFASPVFSAPPVVQQATSALAAADTTISLNGTFQHVVIKLSAGSSSVHLDLNSGTATTADFLLDSGGSYTYNGPGISSFHYLGNGTTGTISYTASTEQQSYTPGGSAGGGGATTINGADGATAMSATNPVAVSATALANTAANPMFHANSIAGAVNSATNGLFSNLLQGNAVISGANPIFSQLSIAGAVNSATNGHYVNLLQGNAVNSAANPVFHANSIAGAVNSATNGMYFNNLQGDAVISAANPLFHANSIAGAVVSATNGLYYNQLQGNAVVSASNPVPVQPSIAGVTVGTANPVPVSATVAANAVGNTIFVSPVQAGAAVGVGNPLYIQGSVTTGAAAVTYRAVTPLFTAAASATDTFTITGSASKTVKVKAINYVYVGTAQGSTVNYYRLAKRSTADTGGTFVNESEIVLDSSDAAPTATVLSYTAVPTLGTLVGYVGAGVLDPVLINGFSPTGQSPVSISLYKSQGGKDIVLRGTGEVLAVNLNAQTLGATAPQVAFEIEWTEE